MAAIHPGTRVGRYEISEHVGPGTLGPVYRATEPVQGTVAVQVLTDLTPEARPAFQELAPRLVALRHPNLASVLDVGEHEGTPYLVVEHAPGGTVLQRLWSGPVGDEPALRLLAGAAEGLDAAQRAGLVHGSLGPERVLLAADERPLVADVGLESLRRPAGALPRDLTAGQAAYLAPEQVAGGGATAASDRYALATLAYHLLTGQVPFGGQPPEVLQAQLHAQPAPPSALNARLGPATDQVVLTGLAKDPARRWQTGAQMVAALREALVRDAGQAPEAGPRRRGWLWAVGAAAAVLLAALVGFLVWRAAQPSGPSVNLSTSTVQAGGTVTVSGSHLPANQVGSIQLASTPSNIGAFQADRYGNVQQDVPVPEDTSAGGHVLSLCWQNQCPASAKLTVTERPPSPSPSPSPTPTPTERGTPTPTPTSTPTPTPIRPSPSAPASPGAG